MTADEFAVAAAIKKEARRLHSEIPAEASIDRFRLQGHNLTPESPVTYMACLHLVAKEYGYANWHDVPKPRGAKS